MAYCQKHKKEYPISSMCPDCLKELVRAQHGNKEEKKVNRTELLRGTEEEIRAEKDNRVAQGFDGQVGQDLTTGEWVLTGTPEDWYQEPGHGVNEGS